MSNPSNRYYCLLIFIGYFLFNLNRRVVIYQFPKILPEFQLTATDAGTISSSQQFSTSIVTFVGGILSDIIPSTILFPFGLIICGISSILFPLGSSTFTFASFLFLNGIGQGLRLPTALRLTKQFSEPSGFATNWSLVLIGVNVAGISTPLLSSLTSGLPWQTVIRASGFLTLAFGLYTLKEFIGAENSGDKINGKKTNGQNGNKKNNETINKQKDGKSTKNGDKSRVSISTILSYPILWIVIGNYFTTGFYRMSLDWTSLYFNEINLSTNFAHLYVTLFELASVFGKILSGKINDHFMKRPGATNTPAMIRVPIVIAFMTLSLIAHGLFCSLLTENSSVIFSSIIAICTGIASSANIVTLSVLSTEISDKSCTGLVSSICTTSTKVGAFVSGYPLTVIAFYFGWRGAYTSILMLISLVTIISAIFHLKSARLGKDAHIKLKIQ